jgi:para-nitrobenzyl esterase
MYSLAWETPALGGRLKAPHALDLPFVFGNTEIADATRAAAGAPELAAIMTSAWAQFGRTGSPATEGLPGWPSYTADRRAVMVFDNECRTVTDPDRDARLLWTRVAAAAD